MFCSSHRWDPAASCKMLQSPVCFHADAAFFSSYAMCRFSYTIRIAFCKFLWLYWCSLHNSSISLSPARFLILTAPTWSASSWYPQLVQQNPFECRFSAFRLLHTGHTWLVKSGSTSKKSHPFWFSASISFLWSFPLANVKNIPLTLRLLLDSCGTSKKAEAVGY